MAAIGDFLRMTSQPDMAQQLGMAMSPQMTQAQAQPQGGLEAVLAGIRNDPAIIQALLNTGSRLLNPTSFNSSGGRIADAAAKGLGDYSSLKTAAADRQREREVQDRRLSQGDRGLDLQERGVEQGDRQLDQSERQLDQADDRYMQEMAQWTSEFGLREEELAARKELWDAQAARYLADAEALKLKAEQGDPESLTGQERIIQRMANIFEQQNVPSDRAYMMAFDVYNKAGMDEAKAIASVTESMGFLASTDKGKQALDEAIAGIKEVFRTGEDVLGDVQGQGGQPASGGQQGTPAPENIEVTPEDIQAAMAEISRNEGRPITFEELTAQQKTRLINKLKQMKASGAQ